MWLVTRVPWAGWLAENSLLFAPETSYGRQGTMVLAFPIVRFSKLNTDGISSELVTYYG